ncbi:hypothetical protein BOTBODRAFT_39826 [Botryobasidium botryosum FD-172 SS1]|uniref:Uncharacterized protein n=1 Tax=Botryobasidium botryosum (strain FD-172 SS1) TaxID=930990 RepID=A0A067LUZ4_BOTB1|nr:hypothetical protein BOTBODRAFT_39826 [Botryobasidium botryosum FD-172 SS1]
MAETLFTFARQRQACASLLLHTGVRHGLGGWDSTKSDLCVTDLGDECGKRHRMVECSKGEPCHLSLSVGLWEERRMRTVLTSRSPLSTSRRVPPRLMGKRYERGDWRVKRSHVEASSEPRLQNCGRNAPAETRPAIRNIGWGLREGGEDWETAIKGPGHKR